MVINNVQIFLYDGITMNSELENMLKTYVQDRFNHPIVIYPRKGKSPAMRFATQDEMTKYKNISIDSVSVPLENTNGKLIPLGGLKPSQITSEDIEFAKRLWYETVYVEKGQDGLPWIDD